MQIMINRDEALELLKKYNKEEFHILHGETVGGCMKWFANDLGHGFTISTSKCGLMSIVSRLLSF